MKTLSQIAQRWARFGRKRAALPGIELTVAQMLDVSGGAPTKTWGIFPAEAQLVSSKSSGGPTGTW